MAIGLRSNHETALDLPERRAPDVLEKDKRTIAIAYAESPNKIPKVLPQQLVHRIEVELYTEWCMNTDWHQRAFYFQSDEPAFVKYIDKETHYALEGQGFKWDEERGRFSDISSGQRISEAYPRTREIVLRAFTERAIDFFRKCEDYWRPAEGSEEKLRVPLGPWMQKIAGKENPSPEASHPVQCYELEPVA